jgi:hypothetical protein
MRGAHIRTRLLMTSVLFALVIRSSSAVAQTPTQGATSAARPGAPHRLVLEAFGSATVTWPAAAESFEATGLDAKPIEFGGGGRITGIWRNLFAQVAATRWSDRGERVFIDSTGARFPLGIPLTVRATYIDISVGSKADGWTACWPYVGAGAGLVTYRESSPFAAAGDDVKTRSVTYHVLGGVEIPVSRWLGVGVEGRYRYVPNVLGKSGVSAALGDKTLGGFQANISVLVRLGGGSQRPNVKPRPDAPATKPQVEPPDEPRPRLGVPADAAVIISTAPVYLLPNAARVALRELAAGTSVRVLGRTGDWIRVEFNDPQFGPRVGYVESRFVQLRKRAQH